MSDNPGAGMNSFTLTVLWFSLLTSDSVMKSWWDWERVWGTPETILDASTKIEKRSRLLVTKQIESEKKEKERKRKYGLGSKNDAPAAEIVEPVEESVADNPNVRTLFVKNIAFDVTEQELSEYFSSVGPLKAVRLMKNDQVCVCVV